MYSFNANTDYYVSIDNQGSSYNTGTWGTVTFPYNSTDLNVTGGLLANSNDTSNVYVFKTITALLPSLTGTVTKTYTPSDLEKWGNAKWTQTTVASGSTVTCNVYKSDGTTLLLSNVTSIGDLSSIDIVANPTIVIKWTLTRLLATDTSPTVSNPSVTWEGEAKTGFQGKQGTFTDTTTSVTAGAIYTLTIPLGFNAKRGRIIFYTGCNTGNGATVFFNTDVTKTISIASNSYAASTPPIFRTENADGKLSTAIFGNGAICLDSVVITGTDLVLTFSNTGSTTALNIITASWEVEG